MGGWAIVGAKAVAAVLKDKTKLRVVGLADTNMGPEGTGSISGRGAGGGGPRMNEGGGGALEGRRFGLVFRPFCGAPKCLVYHLPPIIRHRRHRRLGSLGRRKGAHAPLGAFKLPRDRRWVMKDHFI